MPVRSVTTRQMSDAWRASASQRTQTSARNVAALHGVLRQLVVAAVAVVALGRRTHENRRRALQAVNGRDEAPRGVYAAVEDLALRDFVQRPSPIEVPARSATTACAPSTADAQHVGRLRSASRWPSTAGPPRGDQTRRRASAPAPGARRRRGSPTTPARETPTRRLIVRLLHVRWPPGDPLQPMGLPPGRRTAHAPGFVSRSAACGIAVHAYYPVRLPPMLPSSAREPRDDGHRPGGPPGDARAAAPARLPSLVVRQPGRPRRARHLPQRGERLLRAARQGPRPARSDHRHRPRRDHRRRRVRPGDRRSGSTTATHGLQFRADFLRDGRRRRPSRASRSYLARA